MCPRNAYSRGLVPGGMGGGGPAGVFCTYPRLSTANSFVKLRHRALKFLSLARTSSSCGRDLAGSKHRQDHLGYSWITAPRYLACWLNQVELAVKRISKAGLTPDPFTPKLKKYIPNLLKRTCMSEVARIGSVIIFHLSKL